MLPFAKQPFRSLDPVSPEASKDKLNPILLGFVLYHSGHYIVTHWCERDSFPVAYLTGQQGHH
jgi:hypothetical protein